MNKLFTKIATFSVGLAMAIGVGVAAANNNKATSVDAAPGDTATYEFHFATGSGNTWGTSSSTSSGTIFKNVTWITTLTNAGGYNNGYAGQQFGSSTKSGSVVAETKLNWGEESSASAYYGKTEITKIDLWLNNGSGTINTYDVKVDEVSCEKSGTISKNTSASSDYSKTSKVTYTPQQGHVSGKVKIEVATSSKAFYFAGIDIYCKEPEEETRELTGLRIASGESSVKKEYDVGDSFDPTGLVIQAQWDGAWDADNNVVSDVSWTPKPLANNTTAVTGTYSSGGVDKTVTVNGLTVSAPNFIVDGNTNKPAGVSSSTNTDVGEGQVNSTGVKYGYYALQTYSNNLEFNKATENAYIGNNESYGKYIKKIKLTLAADNFSKLTFYKGNDAIPDSISVPTGDTTGLTRTYNFGDDSEYFALKQTIINTWIQITKIEIFLGSTAIAAEVDTVSASIKSGTYYTGSTLSASNFNVTVTWTNGKADTHPTEGFSWTVNDEENGKLSEGNNTVVVTYENVESQSFNVVGTSIHATSISINETANVETGKTVQLTATVLPSGYTDIIAWSTNKSGVATVDENGLVTGVAAGEATITATINGHSDTCVVSVLAAPDVDIIPTDFPSGGYSAGDGEHTFDGITFESYDMYQNSGIQCRSNSGWLKNLDPLGQKIINIEITLSASSVTVYLGSEVLNSDSGSQSVTVSDTDGAKMITPDSNNYQYIRIKAGSSTPKISSIKIWYAPFVPTVELNENSFEFIEGAEGNVSVSATASHFSDNSSVVFTAESGDEDVLSNNNISVTGSTITIVKANVNPGIVTVTITGTYLSEEATASFAITCNAAARNLLSIAKTSDSSDVEFEKGSVFTITGLVITGTYDKAPLTADVTSECTFKLWDGSSETALTVGTTVLNNVGDYTIRISHASSPAAEVLTYAIKVVNPQNVTLVAEDLGSFGYTDKKTASYAVSLNEDLNSSIDLEAYGLYKNNGMQMNTGKGTYIKNTIAVPGRILRVEMTWSTSGKNSPTVYFGDSYFSAKPTSGGTIADNSQTSQIIMASGNSSYFYLDGTTVSGSCVMTELKVVYVENEVGQAKNFADKYLLMNTYDQGGSHGSTGGDKTCLTQYDVAATAYGDLTTGQKSEFGKLTAAVTRMEDWATANGFTFNATSGTFTQNARIGFGTLNSAGSTSAAIIIVIVSVISLTAVAGYVIFKKKKEQ